MRKREYSHLLQRRFRIVLERKTGNEREIAVIVARGREMLESARVKMRFGILKEEYS